MKAAAGFLLFVATFAATILLMLYFTGNLNQEGIARIAGRDGAPVSEPGRLDQDVGPLLAALREKERALADREARIVENEKRVALVQKELDTLRGNLERILKEVNQSLDGADEEHRESIQKVAESIASMEAQNAAKTLTSDMFTPQEAARILQRIEEDRVRGNILNEMTPEKAALVLQALKTPRYGS